MATLIMYAIAIAWALMIIWKILHYVIVLPKRIKPTKKEVKDALTNYPQNTGQIGVRILERRNLLPRRPNVLGLYDKTFYLVSPITIINHLMALTLEGEITKEIAIVSQERAERLHRSTENVYLLRQTA